MSATLMVGTTSGLYETKFNGSAFQPSAVGFQEPDLGAVRAPIVQDSRNPDRLYAATSRSGVWRSDDRGQSWKEANYGLIHKEVWWLAQHPSTGELFAGTGPVALFRSTDGAEHWQEIEELRAAPGRSDWFLHISPFFARIRTISFDPDESDYIYCAIEEGWLIRSRDNGKSWENLRDAVGHDCHVAALVPGMKNRVLAASFKGMFSSVDGGDSFARCEDFDASYVTELNVHPARSSRAYGAGAATSPRAWRTAEGADSRIYVSDDAGLSWQRIVRGLPSFIHGGPRGAAVDPEDPDVFLVGTTDGEIWVTRDGGRSASLFADNLRGEVTSLSILN